MVGGTRDSRGRVERQKEVGLDSCREPSFLTLFTLFPVVVLGYRRGGYVAKAWVIGGDDMVKPCWT